MFEGTMTRYTEPTLTVEPKHANGWRFTSFHIEFEDRLGNYNGYAGSVEFKACDWDHAFKQAKKYAKAHNLRFKL